MFLLQISLAFQRHFPMNNQECRRVGFAPHGLRIYRLLHISNLATNAPLQLSLSCFLPSDESHTGRVHRNVSTFFDCNGVSSSITSRVRRTCSLNDSND